ncbi:MAG TPA: adenylate/guanylate cyclase domain-containing protein [Thermohalobaculum sp.]|nr:adenylate/guanylate cyclase domain-containing protein [Thermohalobaculum sp.]
MSKDRVERRLAAILAADVVGYSRMVANDEAGALASLRAARAELIDPAVDQHGGRIVKTTGDGMLVEFPSAVDALRCAMAIQTGMAAREGDLALRIGVNVGDVVIEDGDILGDGVNIASRLEGVAEPGGVAISGAVREYIAGCIEGTFRDAGQRELKNIDRPINIWLWSPEQARPAPANAPALPDKPSIAVLPFDNMSGDPDQEYFADGVVEALTAALSRIRAFFVIARNSAFAYKGRPTNVRDIGRELGVAYVLEGSVQRAGGRVRITVQLIETEGGAHIWAEKYDGSLDDIFDLQDRITEQVAGALQPSIRLAEVERARRKRPQDMGAYDYTMRAMRHVWMLEKDEATKALELLDKALEIDPDYPLALALAAWCHAQRSVYNWVEDIEATKAKSLAHAEKAANLSADDPLILAVLGAAHTFARHYGAARVLLERAVALDPNSAWAWSRIGWLEAYADRPEQAKVHFERALRLSPLDPMNFNNYVGLASAHHVAGEDNAAADLFLRALEERPNAHWIHRHLAPALMAAGREAEARASFDALVAAYPDLTVKKFEQAMVFSKQLFDRMAAQLLALGLSEG